MQDGFSAVNDLVTKAAEENKQKDAGAESSKQENSQEKKEEVAAPEEGKKEEPKKEEKDGSAPADDPIADLLKDTEFKTKDELVAHLKKKDKKIESPEELKRKEEVYRANLHQFAVENSIMSNEDMVKLETLKQKADLDLVYEKYTAEVRDEMTDDLKEENPDITQTEIDEKIKEAFDKDYPLESKNPKAKSRAEARLAKEVKEIRGPLESSFTDAQTRYDAEVAIRNAYPAFKKSIGEIISSKIPSTVQVYSEKDGEEDVSVEVPVSEEVKKDITSKLTKKFLTPESYGLYSENKVKDIEDRIKEEAEYQINRATDAEAKKKIAEKFLSRGITKGSTTGAKNSFATNQGKNEASQKQTAADAESQIIDSTRQKNK